MTKKCCRKRRDNHESKCCDPCVPTCCPLLPLPPAPPVIPTNIAVLGTGPFGSAVGVGFTVINTTSVAAANVSVSISANQLGVSPANISTTAGTAFNTPGTSFIIWNVGTLLGGQSALITFNQVGIGAAPNTWTAVGSTTTPEITLVDNIGTVFVPFPL